MEQKIQIRNLLRQADHFLLWRQRNDRKELWDEYCEKFHVDKNTPYEAWSFGDDTDALAKLVCAGRKTATCSLYDLYDLEPDEPLPGKGDISIILDHNETAVCIIKNVKVYQTRFCDVSPEHAYKEGEGDRSLAYWRKLHTRFFTEEALAYGLEFDERAQLVCEEFEVVYRN